MPQYLPDHLCQCQTYSEDLQKHVIYQQFSLNKKTADIAHDLTMSQHVVECILHLWKSTGEVVEQDPGRTDKRRRLMTPDEMNVSGTAVNTICIHLGYAPSHFFCHDPFSGLRCREERRGVPDHGTWALPHTP
jgi:hypothetical protein